MANEPITMVITLMPDGNITVSGPLNDRIMSFGLLEAARCIIQDNAKQQAANEPAPMIMFRPTEAKLVGYPPDIHIGPAKE